MGAAADFFDLVVRRDLEFDSLAINLDDLGFGVDLVAEGGCQVALRPISEFQKFCLTAGANQHYSDSVPSLRGALRNVINAGRDAVDVVVPLTNGADADGQVVSF